MRFIFSFLEVVELVDSVTKKTVYYPIHTVHSIIRQVHVTSGGKDCNVFSCIFC